MTTTAHDIKKWLFAAIQQPSHTIKAFSYALPLDHLVRSGIPVGTGKKAHERRSKRKRPNNPPRDVSDYGDSVPVLTTADTKEESNAP